MYLTLSLQIALVVARRGSSFQDVLESAPEQSCLRTQATHWWWMALHGCGGSLQCRARWSAKLPGAWKPRAAPWE